MRFVWLLLVVGCFGKSSNHLQQADDSLFFALPLAEPDRYDGRLGVDHDTTFVGQTVIERLVCTDYAGRSFPHCYDEHGGTDFLLFDGWAAMDEGSTGILAAADGEVVRIEDGHFDRCSPSLQTGEVDCDGGPRLANLVELRHADGTITSYLHMMKGSVAVAVGDRVVCGDLLGRVGSSGNSSQPHLHFEVTRSGRTVDPFQGSNNPMESLWWSQDGPNGEPSAVCP